ncbi:hypothetical protein [Mesobacillus boroniphilus]|uniref:Uncharacterized protein n=1 Tax=Mesobacillus boroniphilus JCM 21738 TaxID=1294265 RepID=W4RUL5_9BACI|nr:hypothetical protein [Mesobacillus boroniphilus]GAE47344.1 hypothetical protein JCM21738_4316 [Mesobacillus boroniphilus JCM 21738]
MEEQIELFGEINDYRLTKKYREGVFKTRTEILEEMYAKGFEKIYTVLSFGGGTQSAHLMNDMLIGRRKYDMAVFSDTGASRNLSTNRWLGGRIDRKNLAIQCLSSSPVTARWTGDWRKCFSATSSLTISAFNSPCTLTI